MPSRSKQPAKSKRRSSRSGPPATGPAPTDEDVRALAYQLFLARGGEPGHELEDWLQAERELRGTSE